VKKELDSNQRRQGDVLLVKVDDLPANAKKEAIGRKNVIIAHGEVTGHKHQFVFRDAEMFRGGAGQVLRVLKDGAPLQHEEHSPIEFPAGLYERPVQVEHTDEDEPRIVAD